jgi:WD40 repeat protein
LPQVLPYPARFIVAMDTLPYIVTASWSNLESYVWKEEDGTYKCVATLAGHTQAISCIAARGNEVVTGSGDGTCRVWDMETFACKRVLLGCGGFVTCVVFSEDRVVCGTRNNRIAAWNASNGEILYQMDDVHRGEVLKLSVLRDNSIFSCG